ncbi:hypothetical protein [Microvirga sp. 2TAF3]|uniref:hypothetical protein n=1 Tax=Microvirga sp. 2TAF3 TaxID=3233014 RepID=UPI003F99D58B
MTEERLERAVSVLADIMSEHGQAHAHLFDQVKQQLDALRQRRENAEARNSKPSEKRFRKAS